MVAVLITGGFCFHHFELIGDIEFEDFSLLHIFFIYPNRDRIPESGPFLDAALENNKIRFNL